MKNQPKHINKLVWHYTFDRSPSRGIRGILRDGAIRSPIDVLDPSLLSTEGYRADAKLILFSTRQDWEPAAYRGWREPTGETVELIRCEDYAARRLSIYRIGVERKILKPYQRLVSIVRMPKAQDEHIKSDAVRVGSNPFDWWGSVLPVTKDKWRAVQTFSPETQEWVPLRDTE